MYNAIGASINRKPLVFPASAALVLATMVLIFQLVFVKNTYVITDGNRVLVHTTFATDPEIVLGEAGLELGTDDTYTTQTDGGSPKINVRRGQRLFLDYYGSEMEVTSSGESVEELLTRLNLTWQEGDVLSKPLDAETYDGMKLTIARTVREKQTYTAELPYQTSRCYDAALPEGTQRIVTEGKNGQLLCEAAVTYHNGVESKRELLRQEVISPPINEIIAVGTAIPGTDDGGEKQMPVIGDGIITTPTGEVLTFTEKVTCLATAYHCEGYVGTTATGTRARVGAIAVDPEVFPYGTRFYIVTKDGTYVYGVATAEDCGDKRFIYDTRLDLYFNTKKECVQFGARSCDVYILG